MRTFPVFHPARASNAREVVGNGVTDCSEDAVCLPVDEYRREERPKGAMTEKRKRLGRCEAVAVAVQCGAEAVPCSAERRRCRAVPSRGGVV